MTPVEMLGSGNTYRKEFFNTPIPYTLGSIPVGVLSLGLPKDRKFGMVCGWWHRPYKRRDVTEKADYDRLKADIDKRGMLSPVLGWRHPDTGRVHVLVGMRRTEIIQKRNQIRQWLFDAVGYVFGVRARSFLALRYSASRVMCAVIQEDIRYWWRYDATVENSRQARLVEWLGKVDY